MYINHWDAVWPKARITQMPCHDDDDDDENENDEDDADADADAADDDDDDVLLKLQFQTPAGSVNRASHSPNFPPICQPGSPS